MLIVGSGDVQEATPCRLRAGRPCGCRPGAIPATATAGGLAAVRSGAVSAHWGSNRTEAFSDGVFAIAITILVLELSIPDDGLSDLGRSILGQWPSYLAYATSFLTIGGIWLSHHSLFGRLQQVDRRIMQLNLLLLMMVSFLPFPTRLMAKAITDADAERAAVIFYGLVLLVISTLLASLWRSAARRPELLDPEVGDEEIRRMSLAATPSIGFYVVVVVVGLLAPQVAAFSFLVVAIAVVITVRGEDGGRSRIGKDGPRAPRRRLRGHRPSGEPG